VAFLSKPVTVQLLSFKAKFIECIIFSKSGFADAMLKKRKKGKVKLVTMGEMYNHIRRSMFKNSYNNCYHILNAFPIIAYSLILSF